MIVSQTDRIMNKALRVLDTISAEKRQGKVDVTCTDGVRVQVDFQPSVTNIVLQYPLEIAVVSVNIIARR